MLKFVHMIMKQLPLPQIYIKHLGKIYVSHSPKYQPCVLMTLSCMLKHNDMIYCKNKFMSEKSINF